VAFLCSHLLLDSTDVYQLIAAVVVSPEDYQILCILANSLIGESTQRWPCKNGKNTTISATPDEFPGVTFNSSHGGGIYIRRL
jgi:hypothetical protein